MAKRKTKSCDWTQEKEKNNEHTTMSMTYRHRGNYTWTGVKTEEYKSEGDDWGSVIRRVLIGNHGEKTRFHVRYFEISPGGYSSFEKHIHEHVVIVVRGKGKVRMDDKYKIINFLDTIYIKPGSPHQFKNPFNEPFGFLCIVNAKRDRPVPLT